MSLISCNNLEFNYDGKTVLKNVSFNINKGDYLCIVGKNGSGKTTLINGILGVLKPTKGEIIFYEGLSKSEIGYLPQHTHIPKNFHASVYEIVLSGCINKLKLFPFYRKKEKQIAEKNMGILNITDLKYKCFHCLSGGQQQRVLLARALCAANNIIILDEPTASLDFIATNSLYKMLKHINEKHGISVIMISHDIKSACEYSTNILHLDNKAVFYGSTQEYLKTDIAKDLVGGDDNAC